MLRRQFECLFSVTLLLGGFEDDGSGGGGGAIAVESGVFEVTHVDTRGRLAGGLLEQTLCSS